MKNTKGVTIVALIITIIIIFILTSVVISLTLSEDGLFKSAKHTINKQELAQIQEDLELAKITLGKKYQLDFEKYLSYLVEQNIIKNEDIIRDRENPKHIADIIIKGYRFSITDISEEGKYLNNLKIDYIGLQSNLQPTVQLEIVNITTGTIEVQAKSKYANNEEYEYYIKKASEDDSYYIKDGEATDSLTHTFYRLNQNEEYTVKVILKMDGKSDVIAQNTAITVELGDIQEGDIIFELSETEWTNNDITVKAVINNEKFKNYKLQTCLNNLEWNDTDTQIATSNSDIIYAKITDGQGNDTAVAGCSNLKIDKKNPNISQQLYSSNITKNSFMVNAEIEDNESELCKIVWYYKLASQNIYKSEEKILNTTKEVINNTYSNLVNGTYHAYFIAFDNAGNNIKSDVITINLSFVEIGNISGGYNASVNCTTLENYKNLTKDNFFFECKEVDVPKCLGTMNFTKSYNATSGVLTINRSSIQGTGTVYFSGKIYKGANTTLIGSKSGGYSISFDCKSIKNWQNKNVDDFIVDTKSIEIPNEATGIMQFTKKYNSNTGILTVNRTAIEGEGIIQFTASLYSIIN